MELLILLAIILLFFGAKRVPQVGRSLGSGLREFRKGISEVAGDDAKDEAQDRENKKNEEERSRDAAARSEELPRPEDREKTAHTEQKH